MSRILLLIVSSTLMLSFLNFLPRFFWWQEANQTLWLYYVVFHLIVAVLIVLTPKARSLRSWRICLVFIMLSCGIYGFRVCRYYIPRRPIEGANRIQVLFFKEPGGGIAAFVREEPVDIVMVLSQDGAVTQRIPGLESFPYVVSTAVAGGQNFSLYSRRHLEEPILTNVGLDMPPIIIAKVAHVSAPITIAAMQMMPARDKTSVFVNDVYIRRGGTKLRYIEGPVILLAATHTVPFARVHYTLGHVSKMRDASLGVGLLPIWDPGVIAPFFPATHFFVKGGVSMVSEISMNKKKSGTDALLASFSY